MNKVCVVFDLDDTLYKEIDFVKSGYAHVDNYLQFNSDFSSAYEILISAFEKGKNALDELNQRLKNPLSKDKFLNLYRNHFPDIKMLEDAVETLDSLRGRGGQLGLLTDGRAITQRKKILALGLDKYISPEMIVISEEFGSEKPCSANYEYFMKTRPDCNRFIYVGDNPQKDFIAPNSLGWTTIGLKDNGPNIHPQKELDDLHDPKIWVESLKDILKIV